MVRPSLSSGINSITLFAVLVGGGTFALYSQAPATPEPIHRDSAEKPTEVLHVSTQLVVIDVAAEDRNGNAVHNLTSSDFLLTESNTSQTIRGFDAHTGASQPSPARPTPHLAPGTFTDYSPVPASDVLDVLLIDTLNTPLKDQAYLQSELINYIKFAKPGVPTAVFGLSSHLILLQGFSSAPEVLRAALASKNFQHPSTLLPDPSGLNTDPTGLAQNQGDMIRSSATPTDIATAEAALIQLKAMVNTTQLQSRIQVTLEAFNQLGHYLATLPGRKNLVWFSGSFPLVIVPSPTLQEMDTIPVEEQTQFHETLNLLTRARVAVYPVDARGIETNGVFDLAYGASTLSTVGGSQSFSTDTQTFDADLSAEHQTMRVIASDTGGKAFINTNNLTKATALALTAGSDFYSLAYAPTDRAENGKYRSIHVTLTDAAKAKGITLSYRKGYYAPDAAHPHQTVDTATASEHDVHSSFARTSMNFGAPEPSDIVFTTRVLPASTALEDHPAQDNVLDPKAPLKPPFRRFDIDFAAFPKDVQFIQQPGGNRFGRLHFLVFVYSAEGKLVNTAGHIVTYNLSPYQYTHFLASPINVHMEVSAPARVESYFRIGMEDIASHRIGAVQVPASVVIALPPPVYASSTTPSTSQPATPTSSTTPGQSMVSPR